MKGKILVADDTWTLLDTMEKVLSAADYKVFKARDGREAIKVFGQHRFNVVLLDLYMPVKDGWSTLEKIRTINPFIPIIVMTGYEDCEEEARRAGATAFLHKPFLPQELLELLDTTCENTSESSSECATATA